MSSCRKSLHPTLLVSCSTFITRQPSDCISIQRFPPQLHLLLPTPSPPPIHPSYSPTLLNASTYPILPPSHLFPTHLYPYSLFSYSYFLTPTPLLPSPPLSSPYPLPTQFHIYGQEVFGHSERMRFSESFLRIDNETLSVSCKQVHVCM